ncbi:S41 family peptidase [Elizabethkingia ursingii]|uniref:S41 family peptidase n=1 Tax=Elizabethkingia ursingii TaxID=1756150 RepID=UPI0020114699|nr:S41 family peptidase [Elizabethkingia ursingii]MCL1668345.1 S41 family peptidase [Elizabethkingia ursingii]
MKIQIILLFLLSSIFGYVNAQTQCGCNDALQKIILKIESEYPGFDIKTKDKLLYNSVKESSTKLALENKNPSACLDILKGYAGFFKDRHIWVLPNEYVSQQNINSKTTEAKNLKLVNVDLKRFKKDVVTKPNEFEGIWKDDNYEIGVKRINQNEYIGFIIKADPKYWKPNEIKFRLFSDGTYEYYTQDRSVQKGKYKIYDASILFFDTTRSSFTKQLPAATLNEEEIKDKINDINGFYVKKLTPKTTIIKLQNFSYIFLDTIEAMLEKNKKLIENSEFLIIDVRDNGGGTDNAFRSIMPYISTNPIRHVGVEYLSSESFIRNSQKYLQEIEKDSIKNRENIDDLRKRIAILKKNLGKYVNFKDERVSVETINYAPKSPSQIVVLTNNHTGSAAENFLLRAKQSKKVKIMGIPSSGVLDYANAMFFEYGCDNYKLLMPTYRSFRLPDYPIDNIGIQPDIYLDKGVSDWVKFAIEYLES